MNKKIAFLIVLVFVLGMSVFFFTNKDKYAEIKTDKDAEEVSVIDMCYRYAKKNSRGIEDKAWLKMKISGESVTGEYYNLPAEKDSKIGSFVGEVGAMNPDTSSRTAVVWWESMAEGMKVTEELRLSFGEGSAVALFGEMVDRGDGVYVYKDTDKLTGGFQMSQIDCMTLEEMNNPMKTVVKSNPVIKPTPKEESVACTMDAMMCPDGSYVGRVAPDCKFAMCPVPAGVVEKTLSAGESLEVGGTKMRFDEVKEDSRCMINTMCVHAGNFTTRVSFEGVTSIVPVEIDWMKPYIFRNKKISIQKIEPEKTITGMFNQNQYKVTFRIE